MEMVLDFLLKLTWHALRHHACPETLNSFSRLRYASFTDVRSCSWRLSNVTSRSCPHPRYTTVYFCTERFVRDPLRRWAYFRKTLSEATRSVKSGMAFEIQVRQCTYSHSSAPVFGLDMSTNPASLRGSRWTPSASMIRQHHFNLVSKPVLFLIEIFKFRLRQVVKN